MSHNRAERWEKGICGVVILIYSFLVCMQSPLNFFSTITSATDSSVFRYIAVEMTKGGIPYKDSFDHKGPLIYLLNYLGMLIDDRLGIWIIEFVLFTITCYFLYKTARMFCDRRSTLLAVALVVSVLGEYFQGGNLTEEYALPFISISVYFLVEYLLKDELKTWKIFLCGCSFAFVIMLRPNMIAVWIAFVIVIIMKEINKKNWTRIYQEIAFFIVGVTAGMCPFMIYLIKNGAVEAFVEAYLVFNFQYQSGATLKRVLLAFDYFFGQPIIYVTILSYVLLYIRAIKGKNREELWLIHGNVLAFVITYIFLCMPGSRTGHYGMVLIPVLIVPVCMILEMTIDTYRKNGWMKVIVFFWLTTEILYPNWMKIINNMHVDSNYKDEYQYVLDVIEEYCEPEDKISVFGNRNFIYVESDKLSASKYSYQFPLVYIDTDIYQEYKEDIQEEMPKLIFVNEHNETYTNDFLVYIDALGYQMIAENVYICN